jgi:hypothetical protein
MSNNKGVSVSTSKYIKPPIGNHKGFLGFGILVMDREKGILGLGIRHAAASKLEELMR